MEDYCSSKFSARVWEGKRELQVSSHRTKLQQRHRPLPAAADAQVPVARSLNSQLALEVANYLQKYAASHLDPRNEFQEAKYREVQPLIETLTSVSDEIDPLFFQKLCPLS